MAEQDTNGGYANRWKFNGMELDTDTGLYYYNARYYDPSTSVWMSVDPLAEKYPALSPYNYVMNNPINLIDPTGMGPTDWYKNITTGEIVWLDGDQKHLDYEHLGISTWDRNIDGEGTNRFYDGSTKSSYIGKGSSFNPGYKFEKNYDNSSFVKDFIISYIDGPASALQIFGDALLNGSQTAEFNP